MAILARRQSARTGRTGQEESPCDRRPHGHRRIVGQAEEGSPHRCPADLCRGSRPYQPSRQPTARWPSVRSTTTWKKSAFPAWMNWRSRRTQWSRPISRRRMRDKHATNEVINRAGVALGRIKDPSCIETLIEYLMTIHDEVIQPAGGPGSMTSTFNKNGGGGGGLAHESEAHDQPTFPTKTRACSTPWSRSPARTSALTSGRGIPGTGTRRPRASRSRRRRSNRTHHAPP